MRTMRAARLHAPGQPFQIETLPVPEPGPRDVLVKVSACGIVPNLKNVISNYTKRHPTLPARKLPAIYGLDAVGTVDQLGEEVQSIQAGDRVYINPALTCGSCKACRSNVPTNCPSFTFHGYFGFGPGSAPIFERYPYGGFGEYLIIPASNLVTLSDTVKDAEAVRLGYLGTAYSAIRKSNFEPGQTVLIDGVTGTLGVGAAMVALAMGASKVFGTGRNTVMLEKVKAICPERVTTIQMPNEAAHDVVMRETGGEGVHAVVSAVGPGVPVESTLNALLALARGGSLVNCGGLANAIPLDPLLMMRRQLQYKGSLWFSTDEAQMLADMVGSGVLDLSAFEHQPVPLNDINQALEDIDQRNGGFSNIFVTHA
ncbi:MAG: alcohol dehydrogenase [Pusillimonas sp.]|nr:alcohol dehydrogenase [Pusillimonas sp.]